jgi:hypothetical protein
MITVFIPEGLKHDPSFKTGILLGNTVVLRGITHVSVTSFLPLEKGEEITNRLDRILQDYCRKTSLKVVGFIKMNDKTRISITKYTANDVHLPIIRNDDDGRFDIQKPLLRSEQESSKIVFYNPNDILASKYMINQTMNRNGEETFLDFIVRSFQFPVLHDHRQFHEFRPMIDSSDNCDIFLAVTENFATRCLRSTILGQQLILRFLQLKFLFCVLTNRRTALSSPSIGNVITSLFLCGNPCNCVPAAEPESDSLAGRVSLHRRWGHRSTTKPNSFSDGNACWPEIESTSQFNTGQLLPVPHLFDEDLYGSSKASL